MKKKSTNLTVFSIFDKSENKNDKKYFNQAKKRIFLITRMNEI